VEILLLPGCVGPLLAIEPGIDQDLFLTVRRKTGYRAAQDANQNQ
jgi:hypothetical protein